MWWEGEGQSTGARDTVEGMAIVGWGRPVAEEGGPGRGKVGNGALGSGIAWIAGYFKVFWCLIAAGSNE